MQTIDDLPQQLRHAPRRFTVQIVDDRGVIHYEASVEQRQFGTGSWGYQNAGKFPLPGTAGERVQVNVQLTVIGSKKWSQPTP